MVLQFREGWVYLIGIWDCSQTSWSPRQLFANINSFLFQIFVKGCWKCSHSISERLWRCLQIFCTHNLETLKQENCWKLVRFSHPMEDHIRYATLLPVHTLCINWNLSCQSWWVNIMVFHVLFLWIMPFDSSVSQLVRGLSGSSCCFPSLFFQALLQVWFLHQGFSQLTIYLTKPLKRNLSSWSPRCSIFLTFLGSEMNKGFYESMFF